MFFFRSRSRCTQMIKNVSRESRATNFGCLSCLGVLCLWEWPQHIMLGIELALVHDFRAFISSFTSIINIMISSPLTPRTKHFQWILIGSKGVQLSCNTSGNLKQNWKFETPVQITTNYNDIRS